MLYVGERTETQTLCTACKAKRRNVARNLDISTILTFTEVMAVSTFKCNYGTTDNEQRKTESAEFSFTNSVTHLLSNSKRETLAFD